MDGARPLKRKRLDSPSLSPETAMEPAWAPIPPEILLFSLPALLLHPPTHRHHLLSLSLSSHALRNCLLLPNLDKDLECRILTAIVEIGLILGFSERGVEIEVEKALTKALLITQKYPSLRLYKPHLSLLSARLSRYQNNAKMAQNSIRRLLTCSELPQVIYSIHLGLIASLENPDSQSKPLDAIQDLHVMATRNGHRDIALLATTLRLRTLVQACQWDQVPDALQAAESAFNLDPSASITVASRTPLEIVLLIHFLIIAVVFQTYAGDSTQAVAWLKALHELLDCGGMDAFGSQGIVEVCFPGTSSQPLFLQMTHPRVIYVLGFLVSSIAKRDPVGRKPKRRVFATEGLGVLERETKLEIAVPKWASLDDTRQLERRMMKMKADLLSELVGVAIMRSEFDEAEGTIAQLIAHTRTHTIFPTYASRITLYQAQLAHAMCKTDLAIKYYQVAAHLSRKRETLQKDKLKQSHGKDEDKDGCEDTWTNVAARAGEIWIRVGNLRKVQETSSCGEESMYSAEKRLDPEQEYETEQLKRMSEEVVKDCDGLGGALSAVGEVLKACVAKEFLKAKAHLRHALVLATNSQDNHLRALVLALIASHYMHTAPDHALTMLGTSDQLAAGLGAQPRLPKSQEDTLQKEHGANRPGDDVGNAQLRLWIGERFLELNKRTGDSKKSHNQQLVNARFREAVNKVELRPFAAVPL